jgi:ATPase subunit of ABC transporter with duplicated ATPase domains
MPFSPPVAAITLKAVSHRLPDGTALFSDLDVTFPAGRTGLIGRNGIGKSTLLHLIDGDRPLQAGTIQVSGTVRMLTQDPIRLGGGTVQDLFGIRPALDRLARIEAGTGTSEDLDSADWTLPVRLAEALDKAGLPALVPSHPLAELSGGQVTRAALSALTFDAPDFILLDEPTNNLDTNGRALVRNLLRGWQGGALVISHDRALLNEMDQMAELTSLGLSVYGGNWDAFSEMKARELDAAEHRFSAAEHELKGLNRRLQQQKERKARKDSAGKALRARGDIPKIMLNGMRNRAEKTSGDNANLATRRRSDAVETLAEARSQIEILTPITVTLQKTALPASRHVATARGLSGGYVAGRDVIAGFDLDIIGPERIALVGPNGAGKSTLLALLTGALEPSGGEAAIHVPFVMMDQAVSVLSPDLSLRDNYLKLNPSEDETACRAALARFRFRGDAAGQKVSTLSGGQCLSAGLAATIGSGVPPQLLILDEPTNHLDLDALEAVEAGLRAYDGALIVVSHDRAFLDAIGTTRMVQLG